MMPECVTQKKTKQNFFVINILHLSSHPKLGDTKGPLNLFAPRAVCGTENFWRILHQPSQL